MPVYRDYDQAALDAQYNNRGRVPEFPRFVERWEGESGALRPALAGRLDQRYGDGPREDLDFFPAQGASGPAPLLAFIHGGYWQSLSKDVFAFVARDFVAGGIAVANIGYPLTPDAPMDRIVDCVRRAVAWLADNAADLGCDPARLHVSGHSAGGHLTAMTAITDWAGLGRPGGPVAGGIALSGLYDLEPLRLCYLNEALRLDAAAARRNSPIHHLPETAPPLAFAVGGAESDEFHRQQDDFAAAWRAKGLACTVVDAPDHNHFTILDAFAGRGEPLHEAVRGRILG